jgi:hypothetical protein
MQTIYWKAKMIYEVATVHRHHTIKTSRPRKDGGRIPDLGTVLRIAITS